MLNGCQGHSIKLKSDIDNVKQIALFGDLIISIDKQDVSKYELVIQRLMISSNHSVTLETLQKIPLDFDVRRWDVLFCHPGKCIALVLTNVGWKEVALFLRKATNGCSNRSSPLHPSNGQSCSFQQEAEFRISTQLNAEQPGSQPILCHWGGNGAEYVIAFDDGRVLLRSHLQHRNLVNFYPYGRFDHLSAGGVGDSDSSKEEKRKEKISPIISTVDVSPDGSRLVTLCPALGRATLWRSSDQSSLMELLATNLELSTFTKGRKKANKQSSNNDNGSLVEYATTLGRFSRVEGAALSYRFMAIHAPKVDLESIATGHSYLASWEASRAPYLARRVCRLPDVTHYTSVAVSQEGRYIGVGDVDGRVHIYIAFSLQRLYSLRRPVDSHLAPVSDIHFLPSRTTESRENDVEIVSFAKTNFENKNDKTALMWHVVPGRKTVSILVLGAGFIFIVFLFFYTISYFGL